MNLDKLTKYAPLVLRTGIAIVFLWFSFSQFAGPAGWTRMIPDYVSSISPFSSITLIYFNAVFELIFAALLLLGLYTRTTAALLTLHLLHIITILGYGATAARDFSLAIATLAIFFHGADEFCLDKILSKKNKFSWNY